jgi:hypothetical protein
MKPYHAHLIIGLQLLGMQFPDVSPTDALFVIPAKYLLAIIFLIAAVVQMTQTPAKRGRPKKPVPEKPLADTTPKRFINLKPGTPRSS